MGQSYAEIDGLLYPFHNVLERLAHLLEDGVLELDNKRCKILFFEEADVMLKLEGVQDAFHIRSNDVMIIPCRCWQVYQRRVKNKGQRMLLWRLTLHRRFFLPRGKGLPGALPSLEDQPAEGFPGWIKHWFSHIRHLPGGNEGEVSILLKQINAEAERRQIGYTLRASMLCGELLVELARKMAAGAYTPDVNSDISRAELTYRQIMHFLDQHYSRPLSLEEIAWSVDITAEHLARVFKAHSGMTVFEALAEIRLDRAKRLLRTTNLSATAIARTAGFSSAALFSRTFRRIEGVTPMSYRRAEASRSTFSPSRLGRPGINPH